MMNKTESCVYNNRVKCDGCADCSKCGWNPNVKRKRVERIREVLSRKYKVREVWRYE